MLRELWKKAIIYKKAEERYIVEERYIAEVDIHDS